MGNHINAANEPRAAVTGSHKTVGRDGSICVMLIQPSPCPY